jgi:Rrf2 family protein
VKISTRGRYGLRAIVDVAYNANLTQGPVSLKSVAERQGISENYLEQIIAPLKRAGVVHSVRGAGGGYYLAKPAGELTVGDVLRVLEGPLAPADCVLDEVSGCAESDCSLCSAKPVWASLFDSINQVVDNITIADLVVKISADGKDEKQ